LISTAPYARLLLTSLLLLLGGCTRSSSDGAPSASPPIAARPSVAAPSSITAASAAHVDPTAVPTPEDLEEDSAHRITEKNLESELDRLEREIQAE
jgi:hypothetical protein